MKHHTRELLDWMGELAIIHTTGKETNNQYCMVELYATREGSPPWHIHEREDEGFYVIEGVLTVYIGDRVHKIKAGDYILAPKGVPHKYTVDSKGHARILLVCSPAGFENLVRALSKPVQSMKPLTPGQDDADYEQAIGVAAEYGVRYGEEFF
jgi:quercetin dioxygenase-like cupin family protein